MAGQIGFDAIDTSQREAKSNPVSNSFQGYPTVAKAELGTKRVCPVTGRKFYESQQGSVTRPTGEVVPIVCSRSRGAGGGQLPPDRAAVRSEVPEVAEVELVSLEEATPRRGQESAGRGRGREVEVADDPADDATSWRPTRTGRRHDIIGGEREDEEDT